MPSYTPPLRDMHFVLHELLHVCDEFKQLPVHAELDQDTIAAVLEEGGKFASEVLFPLNQIGDQQGCTLNHETHAALSHGTCKIFENLFLGSSSTATATAAPCPRPCSR